jgi:LuxR family maltose regulon positive regulatory protein
MSILATKLYIPPARPDLVSRPCLIERLNEGFPAGRKLTLISAPAGFGKTTLVSEWVADGERPAAWLSLDEGDNQSVRFLSYLIAALQTVEASVGKGALNALQSPQPPPAEAILTALINEIAAISDRTILVLDDYHLIEAQPIHDALTFLLEHLPPQMHLVIATREDPPLPLARLRAQGQLTELRAADLRFTPAEAAQFLNQAMGLDLAAGDITALETRTEGWIAGLQLAALSMQGYKDVASFIQSFTGSHHFVLDYLVEEVLHQQTESIQTFLLHTSILDRMCGPLCDAVRLGSAKSHGTSFGTAVLRTPSASGQETLEYLERANLFIVPLDNERRWYRYHHLFRGFLRQRLGQSLTPEAIAEYHIRASQWYEDNSLEIEAFHHAAAANDVERAERLIEGGEMALPSRSVVTPALDWLASLPTTVLDARPSLWVKQATLSLVAGQTTGVEEKLQAAEAAIAKSGAAEGQDDKIRNLVGQIAAARATLALTRYQAETIIVQAHRAMEYLHPDNLTFRFTAMWTLGFAHHLQGDRAAAIQAYTEAISIGQASGDMFSIILATSALGEIQELENQLYPAAETYRRVLQLHGDYPQPNAGEDHLGLARILYEWNDLEGAELHGQKSLQLTRQYDSVIDRFIICEVFLARLKLAQGDVAGAAAMLAQADQSVRQHSFVHRMPEVAAAQVTVLLRQGNLEAAAHLAETHKLPLSQARVRLAQGDPSAALAVLKPLRREMEAKGWQDERLRVMVLQAIALQAHGEKDKAVQVLGDALALAEPGGFIRTFVDEGPPMVQLLSEASARGILPDYTGKLLAAFKTEAQKRKDESYLPPTPLPPGVQPLIEPLTPREQEVLQLIAAGRSNPEIAEQLVIAVTTVKTHVKNIYGKLQVTNRFQAVARAQDLNLL